jgi:starch synthase
MSKYWDKNIQVVFVADGEYQNVFRHIVNHHQLHQRVAVCDFSEQLEHLAYGASDFVLMPSLFEPCGLPQMIGQIYGALPVVHDTGGFTIRSPIWIPNAATAAVFFKHHDSNGLMWAIDQAMDFHALPDAQKEQNIARIMHHAMNIQPFRQRASLYRSV